MRREINGLSLSLFEHLYHRHKQTTLLSEVRQCFDYFEHQTPGISQSDGIKLIHGSKIELRRVEEGSQFAVLMDGTLRTIGIDQIPNQDQIEMVRRIRVITIPYNQFIKSKH